MTMKSDVERIEHLLSTKGWEDLSTEEKEFAIQELGSEEQYALMRKIGQTLVSERPNLSPDPKILAHLHAELNELHPSLWKRVLQWRVPGYAMVIPLVAFVVILYRWPSKDTQADLRGSAIIRETDTVYISKAPDTVYIERTEVRYVRQQPVTPVYTVVKTDESPKGSDGVSMKENEELEKLLVSGS